MIGNRGRTGDGVVVRPVTGAVLVAAFAILASALSGVLAGNGALDFRLITLAIGVLIGIVLLISPNDAALRYVYLVWPATFLIGWRQFGITDYLRIHPSELIIWLLFGAVLLRRMRGGHHQMAMPAISPLLLAFFLIGVLAVPLAILNGIAADVAIGDFRLLLVLIPVIVVTRAVVRDLATWRIVLAIGAGGLTCVAALAILEFHAPAAVRPLRGFFGDTSFTLSQQGFARADFSFFGGPTAGLILAVILVPLLGLGLAQRSRWLALAALMASVLCGYGAYISGMRGAWLAVVVGIVAYVLLNPRHFWLLLAPLPLVALAPTEFFLRIQALYAPGTYDSSVVDRTARLWDAVAMVQNSPILGHGWGASGWVHCDLVQIAANAGIPALLLFLGWYLRVAFRLYRLARRSVPNGPVAQKYASGLLAGLLAGLVCLSTEALIVLAHLIVPIWFLLAMSECLLNLGDAEVPNGQQDPPANGEPFARHWNTQHHT